MIKVLITGVAGLIGSHMASYLINNIQNVQVIGIDNLSGGYTENIPDEVIFYKTDLNTKPEEVNYIFEKHKPDYVFHFAAYAAEGLSPFMRRYNYHNNILSTATIINNCINHNIKRLIFTSSAAVYGRAKTPFNEKEIPKPIDPYGVAKYACEMDIKIAGEQHGLDWCILRPLNLYGPNQNIWDVYRNVLGIWMFQITNDEPLIIFGNGNQKRAFTYIEDCLESFWKAATQKEASKQIINLGGKTSYTINEASDIIRNLIGDVNLEYQEARHEVREAFLDTKKAEALLGYKEKTNLSEGILKMWAWVEKQPLRKRIKWENYEVTKGLYSSWKND